MTTLTELRSLLLERMGLPSGDGMFGTSTLTSLINAALRQVESEADWAWNEASATFPTVNGTGAYAMPDDYLRTISLRYGDYPPLRRIRQAEAEELQHAAGRPVAFGVFADQLELRPVPTAAVTVTHRYLAREAVLAGDTDEPNLPAPYVETLIEYAAYLGYRRSNNQTDAGAAKAAYDEMVQTMLTRADRISHDEGGGVMAAEAVAAGDAKVPARKQPAS